jgi:hypothetical protein
LEDPPSPDSLVLRMRRVQVILGVAAVAVAAIAISFVRDAASYRRPGTINSEQAQEPQPLTRALSADTRPSRPTVASPPATAGAASLSPVVPASLEPRKPPSRYRGAEAARERITQEVDGSYSLLFRHVGLSQEEQEAIRALLIDLKMDDVRVAYEGGRDVSERERSDKIAAIIGVSRAQEFLRLEYDIVRYSEVAGIGSLLEQRGFPLTDIQRDALLKILVEADAWQKPSLSPDLDRSSIEYLEHLITLNNERERHVIELAPSVLASKQVLALFDHYQYLGARRSAAFERQKQARLDNPANDAPLFMPGN